MTFRNYLKLWVAVVVVVSLMITAAFTEAEEAAQIKTVEVLGESFIQGGAIATARERAISNGFSFALNMVVLDRIPLESLVQHFQMLDQTLFGRSGKYIRDYKVLAEARSDQIYRVLVQATISVDEIFEQLSSDGLLQQDVPSLSKIEIVVSGTRNLADFVKFRRVLSDMPGVNELLIREMRPNETVLIVDFKGDAKSLANALLLKTFDTFGIHISEVMPNVLKIELIPG